EPRDLGTLRGNHRTSGRHWRKQSRNGAASFSTAFPGVARGSVAAFCGVFRTIVVFIAFSHERHSFSSVDRMGGKRRNAERRRPACRRQRWHCLRHLPHSHETPGGTRVSATYVRHSSS